MVRWLVDEERVIDLLENASDYDRGFSACNEALQAALVVEKYIQELNDPFARKLEAIIDTFGWQTCLVEVQSLKPTVMTDYFTPL